MVTVAFVAAALLVIVLAGGMNMAAIRSIDEISAKWGTVTPQRAPDYQHGIEAPLTDWKQATLAAAGAQAAGVQAALAEKRFEKAVNKSSTEAWKQGALTKGVSRWGQGVQLAQGKFGTAFAPFVNAIKALNLPPRFARRDPRNLDRVKSVVDAMINTAKQINS
jgi:hypothetical protein